MSAVLRHLLAWLSLGIFLFVGFSLRCWNKSQVFHDGAVFYIDADCYSRMTRVQRAAEDPFRSIRFHEFENAPLGVHPHTTAPMDLLIVAAARAVAAATGCAMTEALPVAGAFISPALGLLLLAFLWAWATRLDLPYREAVLLVAAVSPILVHGFLLGRPDHQSLILLLVGVAVTAELALWLRDTLGWRMVSAAAWGFALWTSLFEPLVLLLAVLGCRFLVLGRKAFGDRPWPAVALFGGILLFALLFDGWRFRPGETDRAAFFRWAQAIGELGHPGLAQLFPWTGWLLAVAPVLLVIRFLKEKCRISLALAVLLLLTAGLTLWYARWGYFLALVFAVSLPWVLRPLPWKPVVWAVFLLSLWPMASEWDRQLFPDDPTLEGRAEKRQEDAMLREISLRLRDATPAGSPGIVLAPWWESPAIAYWSGLPCVAGSSHQSLPGTVDTAKFYLAVTRPQAEEILTRRKVTWVVLDDPSRTVGNSARTLGVDPPRNALGALLFTRPTAALGWLDPVIETPYFRVFKVGTP